MPVVDREWFFAKMAAKPISLRSLAKLMGLLPASLSRRLAGGVRITLEEVGELARHLDQPYEDVLRAAGVTELSDGEAKAPVVGLLDVHGERVSKDGGSPPRVPRPASAHVDTVALRVDAPGHFTDGWLMFYTPSKRVEPEAVGRLAVVGYSGTKMAVRVMSRGADRGRWKLGPLLGGQVLEVALEWAAPVIGIRC
jgi:hypothetical protein